MPLKGTFRDLSLIDLLQLLNFCRKTGQLKIQGLKEEIALLKGEILVPTTGGGTSDIKNFKTFLLNLFVLPDKTSFFFESRELENPPLQAATIKIPNLILEGCRKITNWEAINKRIPSMDAIFRPAPISKQNAAGIGLSPEEIQVLSAINGKQTLREMAETLQMDQMQIASIVFNLLSVNLIERQESVGQAQAELDIEQLLPIPKKFFRDILTLRSNVAGLSSQEKISPLAVFVNDFVKYLASLSPPQVFEISKALEEISLFNPMASLIEVAENQINASDLINSIQYIVTEEKDQKIDVEIVNIFYRIIYRIYLFISSSMSEEEQEGGIVLLDMLQMELNQ